ncbi:MAG TPA: biopolymer transporter ExbD [Longimicrobiaceae bacterium]|jgi:biopolymer transport protein ExbD/biopolymer transport protein TolR|nr:biopolymer transporter ExbD [Longimicrobiaceae bacterium]
MAMKTEGSRGRVAEINMTPMIDVLLVLLIIFMVVQQGMQRGLAVQVPPPTRDPISSESDDAIVLQLEASGRYSINSQPVAAGRLRETVAEIYRGRPRKVIFVKGAEDVSYGEVVAVVDVTRRAGVDVVGLVPRAAAVGVR